MSRLTEFQFSAEERQTLAKHAQSHMTSATIDAVIVVGSGNITYMTGGIVFPFIDQGLVHPVALYHNFKSGRRVIACTFDLSSILEQLGWEGESVVYELTEVTPAKSLAKALSAEINNDLSGLTVGYDFDQMTSAQFDAFTSALPGHKAISADAALQASRIVKTDAEVRLLEIAGRMGDRGFISALNHSEGAALDNLSYPVWEYGERFRVHVAEFGGSGVGNLEVMQGDRGRDLYSPTGTRETFVENQFIRMEYSVHSYGYWHTGGRTVYVGMPDERAEELWADNLTLKQAAVAALKAGSTASAVYEAVMQASQESEIAFWQTGDIGHGMGTTEREAPFLAAYDDTVLATGMVVVVAVYTFGDNRELLGNKDAYLITDGAPQLLTWYKNFDRLYALHGTSARHG